MITNSNTHSPAVIMIVLCDFVYLACALLLIVKQLCCNMVHHRHVLSRDEREQAIRVLRSRRPTSAKQRRLRRRFHIGRTQAYVLVRRWEREGSIDPKPRHGRRNVNFQQRQVELLMRIRSFLNKFACI